MPRMLDDTFRIVLDPIFNTQPSSEPAYKYPVPGYTDEENMWSPILQL